MSYVTFEYECKEKVSTKLYLYFSTRCRHIVPFIATIGIGWKKKISHSGPVDKAPITNQLGGCTQ